MLGLGDVEEESFCRKNEPSPVYLLTLPLLRCRFHGEGYQEGYEKGSSLGMIEGRQYGTLHGAKIGSEVSGTPPLRKESFSLTIDNLP